MNSGVSRTHEVPFSVALEVGPGVLFVAAELA